MTRVGVAVGLRVGVRVGVSVRVSVGRRVGVSEPTRPGVGELVAPGTTVAVAPAGTLLALASTEFDPRQVVFLPLQDRPLISVTNSSRPKLTVRRFSAHKVEVEVEAAEPAIVVVSQSFYHNWRAYLDGQPTRLLRANHAFQAVEVSAGRHQVAFAYKDNMFRCGVVVSLISAGVWVLVFFRNSKRS